MSNETEKKQSALGELLGYAGSHKGLTFVGLALSAVAMLLGMVPYLCVWLVASNPLWYQQSTILGTVNQLSWYRA